jgi:hypothetical protein
MKRMVCGVVALVLVRCAGLVASTGGDAGTDGGSTERIDSGSGDADVADSLDSGRDGGADVSPDCTPEAGTVTFSYAGSSQMFVVPTCVTHLTISSFGAAGGGFLSCGTDPDVTGGKGGSTVATISVTPGETLVAFVGGRGGEVSPSGAGGFNGGAAGGDCGGAGGGGASDLRQGGGSLANRVVVAGGGGGSGIPTGLVGGAGGATTGGDGSCGDDTCDAGTAGSGGGGTQTHGGTGGAGGVESGAVGTLGTGGAGGGGTYCSGAGGGGGGGYFGGGGGASGRQGSGTGGTGGGGSSFAAHSATGVDMARPVRAGDGQVIITW